MPINTRALLVATFSILFTFGVFHTASAATIIPYGTGISVDTTWTKTNSPYIVNPMGVASGATLTIEPGVVIKLRVGTGIGIGGHLIVGTRGGEPVTITSENDDSVGGDTNNDGTTTPPMPGDWGYIVFYADSMGDFNNTNIRYGGRAWDHGYVEEGQIKNMGGVLTISGGTLTDNRGMSIYGLSGTTTVKDTLFARSQRGGMYMTGGSLTIGNDTFNDITGDAVHLRGLMNFSNAGGNTTSNGTVGAIGFDYMSLVGNNLFSRDQLSYRVDGTLSVLAGATLRILPGTIVKFNQGSGVGVGGTLIVGATGFVDPVIFTSIKDDTNGGDTNGDGIVTTASSGDWTGVITYSGASSSFANTTLTYGGGYSGSTLFPMLQNNGGVLTLNQVAATNTQFIALWQNSGTTTMSRTTLVAPQYVLYMLGGSLIATSSVFDGGTGGGTIGIYHADGVLAVQQSVLSIFRSYGVYSPTALPALMTDNYWGDTSGPTVSDNPTGIGASIVGNVTYRPFLVGDPRVSSDPCLGVTNCYSNVLFLPGVAGSRLYQVSELESKRCATDVGDSYFKRWLPLTDCDNEKLRLNTLGMSQNPIVTKDVIDTATGAANIYASFLNDLKKWRDDEKIIADYSVVPYDWRLSIDDILNKGQVNSDGYIDYTQDLYPGKTSYIMSELLRMASSSRTHKVTIVAHSNGGLVTKALMRNLRTLGKEDIVDKIIFVAVPEIGTPDAVATLLHGSNIGQLGVISDKRQTREISQNMPTAHNILPSDKYYETRAATIPIATFDNSGLYINERANYGQAIGNSSELTRYLLGQEGRSEPDYSDLNSAAKANSSLFSAAQSLHRDLDAWTPATTTKVVEVAGVGEYTIAGLQYSSETYCARSHDEQSLFLGVRRVCDEYALKKILNDRLSINGDGTVVADSAHYTVDRHIPNAYTETWWMNFATYNSILSPNISRKHKDFFEVDSIRKLIKNQITNSTSTLDYLSLLRPTINKKVIKYVLHSPLSLNLYDNQGHHTGISTSTGAVEENIQGTTYIEIGDTKEIITDADIAQHLMLKGYASGSFSLGVEKMEGDVIVASTTFSAIPSSTSTIVTLDLPANADLLTQATSSPLKIDFNGDGIIDAQIALKPNQEAVYDVTPPEVELSFDATMQALRVTGFDSVSSTTLETSSTSIKVTDEAGNVTELTLAKYKIKARKIELVISGIRQNGVIVSTSTIPLTYKWNILTTGTSTTIKTLASYTKTPTTSVETHYRPKQGLTTIMTTARELDDNDGDDVDQRSTREKLQGIHIIKLTISGGVIGVGY